MTNEHNFKKGDRVRYTGKHRCYVETDIDPNETYTVKRVNGNEVVIDVPSEGVICAKELEFAEPLAYESDFLAELSELLRKYDAVINVNHDRYFDTEESPMIQMVIQGKSINPFVVFNDVLSHTITADNLMDFDKG